LQVVYKNDSHIYVFSSLTQDFIQTNIETTFTRFTILQTKSSKSFSSFFCKDSAHSLAKQAHTSLSSHPSHRISFRQIKYRYNLNKLYKIARALNHPAHSLAKQAHTSLSSHPSQTTISCTHVAHVNQCLVVNEALTSVNWEPFIGATLCTLFLRCKEVSYKKCNRHICGQLHFSLGHICV